MGPQCLGLQKCLHGVYAFDCQQSRQFIVKMALTSLILAESSFVFTATSLCFCSGSMLFRSSTENIGFKQEWCFLAVWRLCVDCVCVSN